jgi:hypothetical protein
MQPVERLIGLLREARDGGCRDFDEPRHQLALARATYDASRTWRGLGSYLMPIDQNRVAGLTLCEVNGGCRPKAPDPITTTSDRLINPRRGGLGSPLAPGRCSTRALQFRIRF